jgi:hypothetical protein
MIPPMLPNDKTDDFRDIRPDLKERLREAVEGRDFHAAKASEYDKEVDDLVRQLDREEARFSNRELVAATKEPEAPLTDFILKTLEIRPMSKDDLREYATNEGYDVDGRSIHATLVNLSRTDKIKELAGGVFGLRDHVPTLAGPPPAASQIRRR